MANHYRTIAESSRRSLSLIEGRTRQNLEFKGSGGGGGGIGGQVAEGIGGGMMGSGNAARSLRNYSQFKNWVYVALNAICRRLMGQPYVAAYANDSTAEGGKARLAGTKEPEPAAPGPARITLKKHELKRLTASFKHAYTGTGGPDDLEMLPEHPVLALLDRPNSVQHKAQFLYTSCANLYLTGECYWIGGPNPDSEDESDIELWAVPTSWVEPLHEGGLFTSYKLKVGPMKEPLPVDADMVVRTYFPDPADLKGCISPVTTQISAVKIDNSIQSGQEKSFERGPFPNVLLTVGRKRKPDGTLSDARPILTGPQRKQVIRTVRQVWDSTANGGNPAIIDGLIESVSKLSNLPAEMDWLNSGEQVKKRIFQAFQLNPYIVGEITGVNRAQAVEAERMFCNNTVNPVADCFSVALSEFFNRPWLRGEGKRKAATIYGKALETGGSGRKLLVWIEPVVPVDQNERYRQLADARKMNDITQDEFRAEALGMGPIEEETKAAPPLASTVGGMTGSVAILTAVGQGLIAEDAAVQLFMLFFGKTEEEAKAIVGSTAGLVQQQSALGSLFDPPIKPPDSQQGDALDVESESAEGDEEPAEGEPGGQAAALEALLKSIRATTRPRITRGQVKSAHSRQVARLEREVADTLAPFFAAKCLTLLEP